MEAGGSFAQLVLAGQWRPSAYRLYLDLGVEDTRAMAPVRIEASEDGDEGIP